MTTKNETLKTTAQYAIHFVMRMFWRGMWARLTLIAVLEIIAQSLLRVGDWTYPKLWHLTAWTIWLMVCIIVRIVRSAKCHNCKYASTGFKIAGKTHHQCNHTKYEKGFKSGELSPWDTLQEWYNSCESHEFK